MYSLLRKSETFKDIPLGFYYLECLQGVSCEVYYHQKDMGLENCELAG